jgi:hypothetical protein
MASSNIDRLKHVAMQLCTCTWIEVMTGAGISLYLFFFLQKEALALITIAAFGPLIGFHFAIDAIKPGTRRNKRESRTTTTIIITTPTTTTKKISINRSYPATSSDRGCCHCYRLQQSGPAADDYYGYQDHHNHDQQSHQHQKTSSSTEIMRAQ